MQTPTDTASAIQAIEDFYTTLSRQSLAKIDQHYAADARFKDPFNDVRGCAHIKAVFDHMFATIESPRFVITNRIVQGNQAVLGWDFYLELRGKNIVVQGLSQLKLNDASLITEHIDFWDPAEQLYSHLPILASLMRWLRNRLSTKFE